MKIFYNQKNSNIISIFYIILMSLLVCSCATYEPGKAPFTKEEIANYQNADPDAFTINYINDLEFDVTNTTYEDRDVNGKWDVDRWIKISEELDKYPIIKILAQKRADLANKACPKDMISEQKYYKNFSARYECISYVERGFNDINSGIEQCGEAAQGNDAAISYLKNAYTSHPCERVVFDQKYCRKFSELFEIYPGQKVSCQELKQKRDRALYKQNVDTKTEYQSPKLIEKSFDFAEAEKKCTELGFKAKSEKFADCVIKLSR